MNPTEQRPIPSGFKQCDKTDETVTLRAAAHQWMDAHPVAMDLMRLFASDLARSGRRFGFKLLVERVRWEFAIDRKLNPDDFKINNNWTAYIARQLAAEMPELAALIECRATKAADKPMRPPVVAMRVDPLSEEWL